MLQNGKLKRKIHLILRVIFLYNKRNISSLHLSPETAWLKIQTVIYWQDPSKKKKLWSCRIIPNGHTTSNRRGFDVDITSIRRRPNFDEFPRHFHILFRCDFTGRKIHVVSTYFFRCNFAGRKIHVVSTYFFRCNFAVRKIHVVSRYFLRCNFDGRKIHIVSTYFFRCNFDGRKIHVVSRTFISVISMVVLCTLFLLTFFDVILMGRYLTSFLVSCKLMKTFEKVFPVFVTLNSWVLQDCSL